MTYYLHEVFPSFLFAPCVTLSSTQDALLAARARIVSRTLTDLAPLGFLAQWLAVVFLNFLELVVAPAPIFGPFLLRELGAYARFGPTSVSLLAHRRLVSPPNEMHVRDNLYFVS
jgi:hypothetical protein